MENSNKEASDVGLETLTNDSDDIDESNKESIIDSSEDGIRIMDISYIIEGGLDEEHGTKGQVGSFCDAVSDAEESYAKDDAHYKWYEYHNEDSDTGTKEPKTTNDVSNTLFLQMILTT